jgi:hypothetical protein
MVSRVDQLALEGDRQQLPERFVGPVRFAQLAGRFPNVVGAQRQVRCDPDPSLTGLLCGVFD